ncbi:hypothetical protein E4T66_17945 [Sinimarinibacterium sp. CAU 1509]|uniref:hypothetical protein n=1 Tax=Sinimarinibacterium sp. CAU 1509 TaxID=2562283 RepID=UPI0010AD4217|nr:hypothetical protein [Sinimarinibacterium sp. CAU 1509]TJY57288.1 hypothetical protein E4T66_17945 [Sinimarinibacterium sp. CAU 1509]
MQPLNELNLSFSDVGCIRHWVKTRTKLRESARLDAAVAIIREFGIVGGFHRAQVIEALSGRFYWKCLDRAVDALLAARCVYEADGLPLTQGGGRTFEIRLDEMVDEDSSGGYSVSGEGAQDNDYNQFGFESQDWGFA